MRIEQSQGVRGSLKWIQKVVRRYPAILDKQLIHLGALEPGQSLTWISPLFSDGYAEYRDQKFLDCIGQKHLANELKEFWPNRGPQWDGLASDGAGQVFLFEAKAHASEMVSTCKAGETSKAKITAACNSAKHFFGASQNSDWLSGYYQYANRLAHLAFLRRHGVKAWLVFLYFTGDLDMNGPTCEMEWKPYIELAHQHLGLPVHPEGVISVFQAVTGLQ